MPELPLGALWAEREQLAATVGPPPPPLGDREQLVNLAAALGAAHRAGVGGISRARESRTTLEGQNSIGLRVLAVTESFKTLCYSVDV
jgi:hypothetical protein